MFNRLSRRTNRFRQDLVAKDILVRYEGYKSLFIFDRSSSSSSSSSSSLQHAQLLYENEPQNKIDFRPRLASNTILEDTERQRERSNEHTHTNTLQPTGCADVKMDDGGGGEIESFEWWR